MKKNQSLGLSVSLLMLLCSHYSHADNNVKISAGAYLAKVGDCAACHTSQADKPFAGGVRMVTPVGAIYSTNITPDAQTGIGRYTYNDFVRALRDGVAKDGHYLYPAMPYVSFSKINDADLHTLYHYFMNSIKPISQENRESNIPWPLNMRWPLKIWNQFFYEDKRYQAKATQTSEWNRGAYLVQGLAHCGTCHTPRGLAFQEKAFDQQNSNYLAGGELSGWSAPTLRSQSGTGLSQWSSKAIVEFLKTGSTKHHAAFGPMREVIEKSTQYLSTEDLTAIATYIKSLGDAPRVTVKKSANTDYTTANLVAGKTNERGAIEYVNNCAACHRLDGKGYQDSFPPLANNSAVLDSNPSSLIQMVLVGDHTLITESKITGLTMPGFAGRMDDQQVANVVTFIRQSWGNHAGNVDIKQVSELRKLGENK